MERSKVWIHSQFSNIVLFWLGFPTERDSATFQDKGTEVFSLSRKKGTTAKAQNIATEWTGIACQTSGWYVGRPGRKSLPGIWIHQNVLSKLTDKNWRITPSNSKPCNIFTKGVFICTSPSWLSVTNSSSQCCWTRMASQMIECYQLRCHYAEPQKR